MLALPISVKALSIYIEPWYSIYITLDESNLPEGVVVSYQDTTLQNRELYIRNNSSTPLYIVHEVYKSDREEIDPVTEVPKNYFPDFKLVNGEAYSYAYTGSNQRAYEKEDFSSDERSLLIGNYIKGNLRIDNKNPITSDRPINVTPPPPESFTQVAFYGKEKVVLNGKASFEVNQKYSSKGVKEAEQKVKEWGEKMQNGGRSVNHTPIILIAVVLVTLLAIFFGNVLSKQSKQKK